MMNLLELAHELNLVDTIKFHVSTGVLSNSKQNFQHLIVIDFEATCWKKADSDSKWRQSEIIEFPAVLVDLRTQEVLSEFHEYIRPTESPRLSEFCKNLTGITQETVDNAIPLQSGLTNFEKWLKDVIAKYNLILPKMSTGNSVETAFVTWSDWDFTTCLSKECERKRIKKPQYFDQWIDMKAIFKDWFHYRPRSFSDALKFLGMNFEGREHSGINDARNIARLACRLVGGGAGLKITTDLAPFIAFNKM